jgi:hypothetical protein
MLAIILGVCSTTGGELPAQWATAWEAAQKEPDWVTYYRSPSASRSGRVQFAPIWVSPAMQWAVPNQVLSGPPTGPGSPPIYPFPNYPYSAPTIPAIPIHYP